MLMLTRTRPAPGLAVGLAVVTMIALATPAEAQRSRTTSTRSTTATQAKASASRVVAQGQATYRHGGHRGLRVHRGYPYRYGYYPYYGYPYYAYPYYAYPYHRYSWWWYPYYGYPRAYPAAAYASEAYRQSLVEIDVRPRRSTILVDGAVVGQARDYDGTWDVLRLSPGEHVLEFQRDGYQTLRVELDARGGSYYHVRERLLKGTGPDQRVVTAVPLGGLPQPPQQQPQESTPVAPQVDVRPQGTPSEPHRDAPRQPAALRRGLLKLDIQPDDAVVYLDGTFLGTAQEINSLHGALPVAVGQHRIEVARPGFTTQTLRVEIQEDRTERLQVALEPEADLP